MSERMFAALGGAVPKVPTEGSLRLEGGGEWRDSDTPGFEVKPLLEDAAAGLRSYLMRTAPGTTAPLHAHDEIEQVYVLEGTFSDGMATYGPGDFIVRAPGAPHLTVCEGGSLSLVWYARVQDGTSSSAHGSAA